jgi:uncharacterized protein YhaN
LTAWERSLKTLDATKLKRGELRRAYREKRREAATRRAALAELRAKRLAVLARAGAQDRAELEQKQRAWLRKVELERELAAAGGELAAAAETEPQLAVVEEDLVSFDAARNRQAVEAIRRELADLEQDLRQSHEQLGGVRREIAELEADRRPTSLRFDRAQLAAELEQATLELCAVDLAERAIEAIRARIESACQPGTLQHAAHYLRRLTCDRYVRIWRPLDARRLLVDDHQGRSLPVEHLSGGTREQLFLAIRLALVREFAERGVELPMVLDDVVVNFDQVRTEAAAQTLAEFAADGQQMLLFTCHAHLADLFQAMGVEPTRLPGHDAERQQRRVG